MNIIIGFGRLMSEGGVIMSIIGRVEEKRQLEKYYRTGRPELVIVYGRRRVGKTFLIKEFFNDKLTFYFSGIVGVPGQINLLRFDKAVTEHGGDVKTPSKNWFDAFDKLKILLKRSPGERKVIFIDEMPWLDTGKSYFLSAFDDFWNTWASSNPDILFIGCGSATSWIAKKIFRNKGGLHNRVTGRMYLAPFTISECEMFMKSRNIDITRYQLAECYMIFGGIPYYLSCFERGLSFSQNVDKLCFFQNAPLKNEYDDLFISLFNNPHRHIAIIETLAKNNKGFNRNDILRISGLQSNGHLTTALNELEQCDFIERTSCFNKKRNGVYYYLKDPFTLFYLRFMRNNDSQDEYFWTNYKDDGGHRAWSGYAFERLCRMHIGQIKKKLGIFGVSTVISSWRSKSGVPGAQIDLIIQRKDGVTNLCEIKYTLHPYEITKSVAGDLERRKMVFIEETGTRQAIHITMITTYGIAEKGYTGLINSEVKLDDFFK